MMRLVLKLTTGETIIEPAEPAVTSDMQDVLEQLQNTWEQALDNLGDLPPTPTSSVDDSVTIEQIWEAVKNAAEWLADVAEQVAQTVMDFVDANIGAAGTAVTDGIKYALYLLNRALYSVYRSVRDVLVLSANAAPMTDELFTSRGGFQSATLWQSMGNLPPGRYPVEEIPEERVSVGSTYAAVSAAEYIDVESGATGGRLGRPVCSPHHSRP